MDVNKLVDIGATCFVIGAAANVISKLGPKIKERSGKFKWI